jgi:protein Mpv17
MEMHELRTKCISAGILGLVGDICAQEVGHYFTTTHLKEGEVSIPDASGIIGLFQRLDKRRMLAMFSDGALTTGPLLHFVYAWYESVLPIPEIDDSSHTSLEEKRKAVRKRFSIALIHVLFDNFVMAILYVFLMMVITATLEGKYATIPRELRHDFVPAIRASWKASLMGLAPMQLLSFHFLPVELRVLAVNVQDVIWVTVMSYVTHRNRY